MDDFGQSLRAREAGAMCDHVWIFEARTLSTQPVRRRCGMCGVGTGWNQAAENRASRPMAGQIRRNPSGLAPRAALGVALVLARPAVANWWILNREGSVSGGL